MTDLKAQIRAVMMTHLKSKGYPNMTNQQILGELKPMWIKLVEAKLVTEGYNKFVEIAQAQAHYQNLKDAMAEELSRHFKKKPR